MIAAHAYSKQMRSIILTEHITLSAYAKVNLTLDILGKRDDGYHEVDMILQSIGLCDMVEISKRTEGISVQTDGADLPDDNTNLAYKAAEVFFAEQNIDGGANIRVTKRIPMAAGLAGGSADAAAVLRGLNEIFATDLSNDELCRMGAIIGSDVPFCILGGTYRGMGRGEILQRLPNKLTLPVVIAKPPVSVSTAWAYTEYDRHPAEKHPDNENITKAIKTGDTKKIAALLCNVLESVTIRAYPVIEEYKRMMTDLGASAALMSGSGPTVFGIVESVEQAKKIAGVMRTDTDAAVFVTETISAID